MPVNQGTPLDQVQPLSRESPHRMLSKQGPGSHVRPPNEKKWA